MRVLGKSVYRGPHLYSHTAMVRIGLDLGKLESWPTDRLQGFNARLCALLPSLDSHTCSYDTPGGLLRRMEEGTWLGHVIEHVALELQCLAGSPATRGKTRSAEGQEGVYNVMFEYKSETAGLWAGRYAVELVNSLLPRELAGVGGLETIIGDETGAFVSVDAALRHLRAIVRKEVLGPTTNSIVEAAIKRDIPFMRLDEDSFVQLGWGRHQRRIRASVTDATSHIAVETASDKELTKNILCKAGVPVPQGEVVEDADEALRVAAEIGYPVVVKPLDGNHGKGVTTNLVLPEQVREAYVLAKKHSECVIVEQHCTGKDYRVLIINAQVVGVAERVPAHVTGDGVSNVSALIKKLNSDPLRGEGHECVLTQVSVDEHMNALLARNGLTLDSVPQKGETVWLCTTANLSTGGTAIDRTDEIHPDTMALLERGVAAIGLDIAGVDLISRDIRRPMAETGAAVVEVNAGPGFRMHLSPAQGRPRPTGEAVVSMLFPKEAKSRIPIAAITGTNGKSTTTRMVAHIMRQHGGNVGYTSTCGIFVNDRLTWRGDASGPQSARTLLQERALDYAILETARGGILREGLGFDSCDVGVVLNVSEDHLGVGGVRTLKELAAVKSVVTESVSRRGVSVLNADDPETLALAGDAGGKLCLFSMLGAALMTKPVKTHIESGGAAVLREIWDGRDVIVIHSEGRRIPVIASAEIPATLGGIATFNTQNALAATATAYALGADVETISTALGSFVSTYEKNPGRLNIYDGNGFRVIMDYAHNPAALKVMVNLIGSMSPDYRNLIGTISTPGDRRDSDIREMGRIAATGFDFLVFREDPDRRGRQPGEILQLLAEGAMSEGFSKDNMLLIGPEEEAITACLQRASTSDLVLLTPTNIDACWRQVTGFAPRDFTPTLQGPGVHLHAPYHQA